MSRDRTGQTATTVLMLAVAAALAGVLGYWAAHRQRVAPATPRATGQQIDVNHADAHELQLLPSVGQTRAARTIDHRQLHGPFVQPADLEQVHMLGPTTVAGIEPYITLRTTDHER